MSFNVTVNDAQSDCATRLLNAAGLPNDGRPSASFSHKVQLPLWAFFSLAGAAVMEPRLEASVIEPFCKKTRSPSSRIMVSLCPFSVQCKPMT